MEAPGRLIVKAMLNGVQNGRGGKGSVFVFASGNGGAVDDQCNFDGYTNSLMSITVGAIDRKGLHPFYSEACSANMVVTYSSGSGDNIVRFGRSRAEERELTGCGGPQHTTDVGKNSCTDRHGGTSAAAPIAAGIFALVLEVRYAFPFALFSCSAPTRPHSKPASTALNSPGATCNTSASKPPSKSIPKTPTGR
jgi:kexin